MVPLCPELMDAATEEPELNPELHQHTQVPVGEGLKRRDRCTRIVRAAGARRICQRAEALGRENVDCFEGPFTMLLTGKPRGKDKFRAI